MKLWFLLLVIGSVFGGMCIVLVLLATALKRAGIVIPGGFSEVLSHVDRNHDGMISDDEESALVTAAIASRIWHTVLAIPPCCMLCFYWHTRYTQAYTVWLRDAPLNDTTRRLRLRVEDAPGARPNSSLPAQAPGHVVCLTRRKFARIRVQHLYVQTQYRTIARRAVERHVDLTQCPGHYLPQLVLSLHISCMQTQG